MRALNFVTIALTLAVLGCGKGVSDPVPETGQSGEIDAGKQSPKIRKGVPIVSIKTGQRVGKPMLQLTGMAKALVGKQLFLVGDRPNSKPLGVSFFADSTWMNSLGDVGRFEVDGTTLLVTNDVNATHPHVFPKAEVEIGDVVVVQAGGLEFSNTITDITEAADPKEILAAVAEAAEPIDEPEEIDGYKVVSFTQLANYQYNAPMAELSTPEAKTMMSKNKIPDTVQGFNGKKVAIRGYMEPLVVENGLVTEFIVYRDQSACCFGKVPKINEWITVKMTSDGVKPLRDVPIYFFGTLKVGAVVVDDFLVGLYEMNGDKIGGPL